jgi:hypothetical protein
MTEATYLLDFSGRAQRALLDFIAKGAVEIANLDAPAVDPETPTKTRGCG